MDGCDRIGIAIECMHGRACIQQTARIATRAERGIDDDITGCGSKRLDDFLKQDRDMVCIFAWAAHLFFALASSASASERQVAMIVSMSGSSAST